jgi:hypothetical protein
MKAKRSGVSWKKISVGLLLNCGPWKKILLGDNRQVARV